MSVSDSTNQPPSTAGSVTSPSRPTTSSGSGRGRPRTGVRRPKTVRPDTSISIGELPDQTFFREGDDFSEEGEFSEEEEEEEGVFAFRRPITAAVPGGNLTSGDEGSASGRPTTGTSLGVPTTAGTHATGLRSIAESVSPAGNVDAGGHIPELTYDAQNPPIFSGRNNLNNSAFAFSIHSGRTQHSSNYPQSTAYESRPTTGASHGQSLMAKIARRRLDTGTTDMTDLSQTTQASAYQRSSFESGRDTVDEESNTDFSERPKPRKTRSSAPLIPGSSGGATSSEVGTESRRGYSRGSYGMTEMTGDMTVPDGKTTWGDGLGGIMKHDGSDPGFGSQAAMDVDMLEEDSPYPEVRASVSNIDDVEMPALTIRSWCLGMFLCVVMCAANTFFYFRTPAPTITPPLILVIAYPLGKTLAWIMPIRTWRVPPWLGGWSFSLNPGPFNIKEHAIISMMANVSIYTGYGLHAIVTSEIYFGHTLSIGFSILFVLTTQVTGLSFAGLVRRFVVRPASMTWPTVLVVTTTLNTFHAEEDRSSRSMSRYRFFSICAAGAFAYYFIPGFLFKALSYFSWVCWIAPNNRVVNQLFGVTTGLGMGILTFDWAQITYIAQPLITPWWASVNLGIGFVICYWIIVPILYYTNVWYTAYIPISVIQMADRFGDVYDLFAIITPDLQLNTTAYAAYSPVYISATFSMTYMLSFALTTGVLVHTALHHGPRIYATLRRVRTEADDIHQKLMMYYPDVPHWWFIALFVVSTGLCIAAIEYGKTDLPVYGLFLSLLVAILYVIPTAFIFGMTGIEPTFNLISELIPGYLFPGKAIPGMVFKVYALQTVYQAMTFTQDMKLGHYMKVPPRSTWLAQLSACCVTCFVQVGMKQLLFHIVPDICSSTQANFLTCGSTNTFATSAVVWGLVGPARLFNKGAIYNPQLYAFLIGGIIPIPLWWWVRKYPRSIIRNINFPVMMSSNVGIPPATGMNYSSFLVVGFIFQYYIRRRFFAWWSKYNYVLGAALAFGTVFSGLFIFLTLNLPKAKVVWWGNTVYANTLDWQGVASYLDTPPEGFGPTTWPT